MKLLITGIVVLSLSHTRGWTQDTGSIIQLSQLQAQVGDVEQVRLSPDGNTLVYVADQEVDDQPGLYAVHKNGGTPFELSGDVGQDRGIVDFQFTPNGDRIVYTARIGITPYGLYSVAVDGGGKSRLNSGKGLVEHWSILANGSVAFIATEQVRTSELWTVPIEGEDPVRLNGSLVDDGDVVRFIEPFDPASIVYIADQEVDERWDLYLAPLDGSPPVKLAGPLLSPDDWISPTPDKQYLVSYQHDPETMESALKLIPLDGGPATLLSELVFASDFKFSADGQSLLCRTESWPQRLFEVPLYGGDPKDMVVGEFLSPGIINFGVSPSGEFIIFEIVEQGASPGQNHVASIPSSGGIPTILSLRGRVAEYAISPNGEWIFYTDYDATGGELALFKVRPNGSKRTHVFGASQAGERPHSISFSADGENAVFESRSFQSQIYSVPVNGGPIRQYNDALGFQRQTDHRGLPRIESQPGTISSVIAGTGERIYYVAYNLYQETRELFTFESTNSERLTLNAPLPISGTVDSYLLANSGQQVVYLADQESERVDELWSVPLTGGPTVRINSPLLQNREVRDDFVIADRSQRVIYRTNGENFWEYELFSAPINGGAEVKISPRIESGTSVTSPIIIPGSERILFVALPYRESKYALFSEDSRGGSLRQLSNPLSFVESSVASRYLVSADGTHILYIAITEQGGRLYRTVDQANSAVAIGSIDDPWNSVVAISPDSSWMIYEDSDLGLVAYQFSSGNTMNLTGTFPVASTIEFMAFNPGGSHMVFAADGSLHSFSIGDGSITPFAENLVNGQAFGFVDDQTLLVRPVGGAIEDLGDLFSASIHGGPALIVAQNDFVSPVVNPRVDPLMNQVVYLGISPNPIQGLTNSELYSVPLSGGSGTRLSHDITGTRSVYTYDLDPLSQYVYFLGPDQADDGRSRLYRVPIGGGMQEAISIDLLDSPRGALSSFSATPSGCGVLNVSDDGSGEKFQLYLWQRDVSEVDGLAGFVGFAVTHCLNGGTSGDDDGDGRQNLLEYAVGSDPMADDSNTQLLSTHVTASGVDIRFPLAKPLPDDLIIEVQVSEDLTENSWTSIARKSGAEAWSGTMPVEVVSNTADTTTFSISLTGAESHQFIRLLARAPQ